MEFGQLDPGDHFDGLRLQFVDRIEEARSAEDEEALANVLGEIIEAAHGDLSQTAERGEAADELVTTVDAWASVLSYATTRFYFEGPESIRRRGGYSKGVVARLEAATSTFKPFLHKAIGATGASGFSISVGFPLGMSVALEWTV